MNPNNSLLGNAVDMAERLFKENQVLTAGLRKIQLLTPEFGKLNAKDVSDIILETLEKITP